MAWWQKQERISERWNMMGTGMGTQMGSYGIGMMVFGGLAMVLGLALLASLIVLVWVAIGRLRRDPMGPAGRS